jgi:hypothetical protein
MRNGLALLLMPGLLAGAAVPAVVPRRTECSETRPGGAGPAAEKGHRPGKAEAALR